jgi:hypothetical protein
MYQELRKLMKEIDGAAARMNAGLSAVAMVLGVVVGASLTFKLADLATQALLTSQGNLLLGP